MGRIQKKKPNKGGRIAAKESVSENYDRHRPVFSLTYINKAHCLSSCTKDEKAAFADTLHKLSQCTWLELKQMGRHGMGYEKIKTSSLNVVPPLHLKNQDVDFIAFRFCSMAPMVGYRQKSTFYIIWIDRTFTVYPH